MTALNKQALRNLALRATPGPWTMEHENIWYYENGHTKHLAYFYQGDDVDDSQDDVNTRYVAAADPSTVLALLDELEAAEKRIAELEAREVCVPRISNDEFWLSFNNRIVFCEETYRSAVIKAIEAAGIGVKGE